MDSTLILRDDGDGGPQVQAVRLDDLLPPELGVGLLKIDAEGFEQCVLRGAAATLAHCRPLVYLENDRVDRSRALIEWLWAADHRLMWHIPLMFNPANFAGEARNLCPRGASFNMLAVPREAPLQVEGSPLIDDASARAMFPRSGQAWPTWLELPIESPRGLHAGQHARSQEPALQAGESRARR